MSHSSSLLQDEPMLRLLLADDGPEQPSLQASLRLLCAGCSCVRDMPDSDNWDLSNLLIDGHPVSRGTVAAWLNVLYMQLEDTPFPGSQGQSALGATRLYQLLAFADAVGSIRGVLRACLPKEELQFEVKIGERSYRLDAGEAYVWKTAGRRTLRLCKPFPDGTFAQLPCEPVAADRAQSFTQQLVDQVESLLYLSHKLQLAPLQQQLVRFVRANMAPDALCPPSTICKLITRRVVLAAAEAPQALEALVQLLLDTPSTTAASTSAVVPGPVANPVRLGEVAARLLSTMRSVASWVRSASDDTKVALGLLACAPVTVMFFAYLTQMDVTEARYGLKHNAGPKAHPMTGGLFLVGMALYFAVVQPIRQKGGW